MASKSVGIDRINELAGKFPEIPRTMVVKADVIREGMRRTPIMSDIGQWALPDAHDYFEYDREDTHTKEEMAAGYALIPHTMYLRDGVAIRVMFDSGSPYEVVYEGRGLFMLYRDGEPLEEVRFPLCPKWYRERTSSGRPMSSVLGLRGDGHLLLAPSNYCEFFKDGNQCIYCNMNPSAAHFSELGQERSLHKQEEDVYEAYLACARESDVDSLVIVGGSRYDRKREADLNIRMLGAAQRAMVEAGKEVAVATSLQAMEEEDQARMKQAGFQSITHSMEVWDEDLFNRVCPGKARNVGWKKWTEALVRAVDIFGRGRVSSNFVLGVEMAVPFGFRTEEEGFESNMKGWEFLASHGVRPNTTPWREAPGSGLEGCRSPRTEYVLRLELERYRLLTRHNLYSRGRARPAPGLGQTIRDDWLAPDSSVWQPALRFGAKTTSV